MDAEQYQMSQEHLDQGAHSMTGARAADRESHISETVIKSSTNANKNLESIADIGQASVISEQVSAQQGSGKHGLDGNSVPSSAAVASESVQASFKKHAHWELTDIMSNPLVGALQPTIPPQRMSTSIRPISASSASLFTSGDCPFSEFSDVAHPSKSGAGPALKSNSPSLTLIDDSDGDLASALQNNKRHRPQPASFVYLNEFDPLSLTPKTKDQPCEENPQVQPKKRTLRNSERHNSVRKRRHTCAKQSNRLTTVPVQASSVTQPDSDGAAKLEIKKPRPNITADDRRDTETTVCEQQSTQKKKFHQEKAGEGCQHKELSDNMVIHSKITIKPTSKWKYECRVNMNAQFSGEGDRPLERNELLGDAIVGLKNPFDLRQANEALAAYMKPEKLNPGVSVQAANWRYENDSGMYRCEVTFADGRIVVGGVFRELLLNVVPGKGVKQYTSTKTYVVLSVLTIFTPYWPAGRGDLGRRSALPTGSGPSSSIDTAPVSVGTVGPNLISHHFILADANFAAYQYAVKHLRLPAGRCSSEAQKFVDDDVIPALERGLKEASEEDVEFGIDVDVGRYRASFGFDLFKVVVRPTKGCVGPGN